MSVLYLCPAPLSVNCHEIILSQSVISKIHDLQQFIVEDIRTARRFLLRINHPLPIEHLQFEKLNEHTTEKELTPLLPYLLKNDTGIFSDAGVPGIADPGADIVRMAHANGIKVVPLVGASSILMALMASGLNGQSFAFVGYLPIKTLNRKLRLSELEKRSAKENQTQIFIETPYRNMQLLDDILTTCKPATMLTVAADITGNNEFILTKTIEQWKRKLPEINKIPSVFLLLATSGEQRSGAAKRGKMHI